jgi:hypothetical protein
MSVAGYDPELPFLIELERQLRARAEQAERSRAERSRAERSRSHTHRARAPQTARVRALTPLATRLTRRTAILAGLIFLIAATAFGARSLFSGAGPSPLANRQGAFVLLARGSAGSEDWALRLYARDGQLCRALVVGGQAASSRCAGAPGAGQIGVSSLQGAARAYVFGLAGAGVSAVRVRAGRVERTVATHPLAPRQARIADVSRPVGYFILAFARPPGSEDPPAIVTALEIHTHRVGATQLVCLQEAGPPPCGP